MPDSREEDISRNNAYLLYTCNLYGHALAQELLSLGRGVLTFTHF